MSIRQACTFYNVSKTALQRWLKNPSIKQFRDKPPTKILNEALLKDVEQYPDDYLYERARRFNCSKTSMHTALKRLGISQKKTSEHPKACPIKRAAYQSKLNSFMQQSYPIVYMDESGFEAETIRPYGYSTIGKPCIDSYNWQAQKRTNVIGALYEKMLFTLDYFEQNINSSIFYEWCKYTLISGLKTKCVIVMNNARFHKNKRIQKLLNRYCHRILWLPPYSPDLNPTEKKWAQAKFLRQGWMKSNLPKLFYDMGCISFIVA